MKPSPASCKSWCMRWRSVVLMSGSFPNGGRKTRLETTPAPPLWYVTGARARDVAARSAEVAAAYSNRTAVQCGYIIMKEIAESAEVRNMAKMDAQ